ncbi:hypothetical protein [Bradyrhizobium elkanii]|uniref:ribonuclease toxin HepT-like protein n=2 Tax=Bradyrhizobium elkanii TaxID=29448 RepID=UPI001F0A3BE0|nr:hypothetical protein [Bradyrhizobium elkanii]
MVRHQGTPAVQLMPTRLSIPFAKLATKLDRARQGLVKIDDYLGSLKGPVNQWARGSALALGVHNIYNSIEDLMLSLANDVDGYVPTGESAHQDLLDQVSAGIDGKRPALFGSELYGLLVELKAFRHVIRHRYGFDLDPRKVDENLARVRTAFPAFVKAVTCL